MPRPKKCRKICMMPDNCQFGPLDKDGQELIYMSIDEYETIRLIDLEGFTQEMCASRMQVARTTVQWIYNEARQKLADALVNGKRLRIEGGDYTLCDGLDSDCCQNSSCCKRKRAEMNEHDNAEKELP